jgi:hypothetical protein
MAHVSIMSGDMELPDEVRMADDATQNLKVLFERSPICPVIVATGAWSGGTSDGHLDLQFVDRSPAPKSVTVQQVGTQLVQTQIEPVNAVAVRTVVAELLMSPSAAWQVARLIDNLLVALGVDVKQFEPSSEAKTIAESARGAATPPAPARRKGK